MTYGEPNKTSRRRTKLLCHPYRSQDRGYDTPAIRTIIKEREEKRKDSASYENRLATTDTYRSVIGLMKTGRPVPEPKSEEPPVSDTPPEKKTEKLEIPPVFRNAAVD
jgi:hypothetical protein